MTTKIMIKKEDYCEFCDGIAKPARVEHTFERYGRQFEYKNILALKCNKCGAVYLDGLEMQKIEKEIEADVFAAV